jgi:hypothetical protein
VIDLNEMKTAQELIKDELLWLLDDSVTLHVADQQTILNMLQELLHDNSYDWDYMPAEPD